MKNSIKILVCNENREERERLVQYLNSSGYGDCDEARDGDAALDYISRGTGNLIPYILKDDHADILAFCDKTEEHVRKSLHASCESVVTDARYGYIRGLLAGGVMTQSGGFATISNGAGVLVVGLASVIIGEAIIGKRGVTLGLMSVILGSVLYQCLIRLATSLNIFPAYYLKLVSAVIVALAIGLPAMKAAKGGKNGC